MTTEELLADRYKVIAPYPHSPYEIGNIITMPENGLSFHLTTIHYTDEFGDRTASQIWQAPAEILKYPHLFQKLHWYDDRKPEDLPDYLKDSLSGEIFLYNKKHGTGWMSHYIEPATKEEHEAYINKPQQP